ncbi:MAG: NAD(P)H-quinone oxidoreductase [Egibacteraceae bacterium]
MRAVTAPHPGGPDALRVVEVPDPVPRPDELLVAVHAAGVNRGDVMQRRGRYPPPRGVTEVLGLEMSGEVAAVGGAVTGWSPGEGVCAVVAGGGYAELVTVPAAVALPIPRGLTLTEAACTDLGADIGINYRESDFAEVVAEATGGRGVDVVLDIMGAAYLERNLACLAVEGRLVVIGLMGGTRAEVDLGPMLTRRLSVAASTLRARTTPEKAAVAERLRREVWPGFADGTLRPVIDRVLPLDQAAEAHRVMQAGEHVGKIVLAVR